MELILTWVIRAEHTGAFPRNPSFAWIKKKFNKNITGTRHPVLQKGHFHTTATEDIHKKRSAGILPPVWNRVKSNILKNMRPIP